MAGTSGDYSEGSSAESAVEPGAGSTPDAGGSADVWNDDFFLEDWSAGTYEAVIGTQTAQIYYAGVPKLTVSDNVISSVKWYNLSMTMNSTYGPFTGISAENNATYVPTTGLDLGAGQTTVAASALAASTARSGIGTDSELMTADGEASAIVLGVGWMSIYSAVNHSIDYRAAGDKPRPVWFIYSNLDEDFSESTDNFATAYGDGTGNFNYIESRGPADNINRVEFNVNVGGYDLKDKELAGLKYRFSYDDTWTTTMSEHMAGFSDELPTDSSEIAVIVYGLISSSVDTIVDALITSFPKNQNTFARSRPSRIRKADINAIMVEEDQQISSELGAPALTSRVNMTTGEY